MGVINTKYLVGGPVTRFFIDNFQNVLNDSHIHNAGLIIRWMEHHVRKIR